MLQLNNTVKYSLHTTLHAVVAFIFEGITFRGLTYYKSFIFEEQEFLI